MRTRLPVVLAVAGLLLLAVLAAAGTSGIPTGTPDLSVQRQPSSPTEVVEIPPVSAEPYAYTAGVLIVLTFVALLLGLAVLLAVLAGIRFRRKRRLQRTARVLTAEEAGPSAGWLSEATRRAVAEMDRQQGGPPSDAVIAAWVELERSAARTGTRREPHQTPTEFTTAIIAGQAVDTKALNDLRVLYHRARFGSPGTVTPDDAKAARTALEKIT